MDETINQTMRLMELWGEMATRMAVAGMQANPQSASPEAARRVRANVFQAMAQFADQNMRSPEFLAMLKQGFDNSMKAREQAQEMLTRLHHEFQGVARKDVESLLRGVHQAESRIVERFIAAYGNCPAWFLQTAFTFLKPVGNLIEKPVNLFERLEDDAFIDDYFAMEGWLNDNIPVPGEVYREFVKYLYQQNRLTQGTMPLGRHVVNLKNITCPVLNPMANKDDLVPCSQSRVFNDLVSSTDRRSIEFNPGHIGLAVSSRAQKELWPQAVDWLASRSDPV